jgi:DNA-binding NarL/FixJ family response regulator
MPKHGYVNPKALEEVRAAQKELNSLVRANRRREQTQRRRLGRAVIKAQERGMSSSEIGRQLGLSHSRIDQWAREVA